MRKIKNKNEDRKKIVETVIISQLDTAHCLQETEIWEFENGETEHYMWHFLHDFSLSMENFITTNR